MDWIRSLHFATISNKEVLLASSSQDTKIRIWKITQMDNSSPTNEATVVSNLLENLESGNKSVTMSSKGHLFKLSDLEKYSVILESVLSGHDEWVNSVRWHPPSLVNGSFHQPLALLSASMDRTMLIWTPSEHIWVNSVRFHITQSV